ncbi:MAG: hypothetical protein AABZ61_10310 [Bacteroidota bacterium]
MNNPLDVVIAPSRLFSDLRRQPSWLVTFAAITVVSMVVEWFSFRFALEGTVSRLPQRATEEMMQDAIRYLEGRRVINVALVPLKVGVPMAVFSFVIYLVCSVSKPVSLPHWRHFLAVVVWAGWTPTVGKVVALLTRFLAGAPSPASGSAIPQTLGLGMVQLTSKDPGLLYILNGLNIFSIWYILLVSLGVSILCSITRRKGIAIVASVWVFGLLVSAALLRLAVGGVQ